MFIFECLVAAWHGVAETLNGLCTTALSYWWLKFEMFCFLNVSWVNLLDSVEKESLVNLHAWDAEVATKNIRKIMSICFVCYFIVIHRKLERKLLGLLSESSKKIHAMIIYVPVSSWTCMINCVLYHRYTGIAMLILMSFRPSKGIDYHEDMSYYFRSRTSPKKRYFKWSLI